MSLAWIDLGFPNQQISDSPCWLERRPAWDGQALLDGPSGAGDRGGQDRRDVVRSGGEAISDWCQHRKVEVVRIEGSYAVCLSGPRQVKVRLDYIFSDGKPRRSGYSTVAEDDGLSSSAGLTQP